MEAKTQAKYEALKDYLRSLGTVAVAFSGGVDSTLLLKTAHDVLGDGVLAITEAVRSLPRRELKDAEDFCRQEGIRHLLVQTDELTIPGFAENPPDRCYICKTALFSRMLELAKQEGFPIVAEGSNLDDEGDYRPGLKAIGELKVASPLRQAGLYKAEIREISKELGLNTWDKPSAACLSSRFVYGETITREKLQMVEQAEELLHDLGFSQVRVRIHGEHLARIEVRPEDLEALLRHRERIVTTLRGLGFLYVTMDLSGYRTGSMNAVL